MASNIKPAQPTYRLYSYSGSSCSARIVIAAQLLGISLELSPVNLVAGEHITEAFRLINPSLAVPVLIVREPDGQETRITQSIAILEYFEEVHGNTAKSALLPSQPKDRARVRELVGIIACDLFPPVNGRIAKKVRTIRGEVSDQISWVHDVMAAGFASYEVLLKGSAGRYSFGDEVSMADVFLVPAYDMAMGYKLDLAPYPNVRRVYEELVQLEAFKKANWAV